MTQNEACNLHHEIAQLLAGNELGLLRAEKVSSDPGYWGVTIKLTHPLDWVVLKRAITRQGTAPEDTDRMFASPAVARFFEGVPRELSDRDEP